MGFLDDLRMANIFPRNPAKDRPFGMPNIDSGNVGAMLRQIIPLAESMNRDSGLSNVASRMRSNAPLGLNLPGQGIKGPVGRHSVFDPNANVRLGQDSGVTQPQAMFLRSDAQNQAENRKDEDDITNFMRQQDLIRDKYRHEEDIANKEIAAKTSLFDRELGGKMKLADKELAGKSSLFDKEAQLRKDINDQTVKARSQDVVTRETLRNERTKANTPKQDADAYKFRAQKLKTENDVLGKLIDVDENGVTISHNANPEQRKRIMAALNDEEYHPPSMIGEDNSSVKRQRNPKTGAIRESTDGGKTWKIISNGSEK